MTILSEAQIIEIIGEVESHALKLGRFEKVNRHEPKNAPGKGLTAAIWMQRLSPLARASGLTATSVYMVLNVRLYTNMLAKPEDMIDPRLIAAAAALMEAYSGDFDLGGRVRNVDLLGMYGEGLSATAGYINQDQKMYRVITLNVPLVVNDAWTQVA